MQYTYWFPYSLSTDYKKRHSLIPLWVEGPHNNIRASCLVFVGDELHDVDCPDVWHVTLKIGRVLTEADHARHPTEPCLGDDLWEPPVRDDRWGVRWGEGWESRVNCYEMMMENGVERQTEEGTVIPQFMKGMCTFKTFSI